MRRKWDVGDFVVRAVTRSLWDDLLELFGDRGAYSNCWCMFFRVEGREFDAGVARRGAGNRKAFKALVEGNRIPGLLAYNDQTPVGWCSVAPRPECTRLQRSPVAKPLDDAEGVWSVVCFYIDGAHRGTGVASALLKAAVEHATERGAKILEGYPVDPGARTIPNYAGYHGLATMFEAAGFTEVARRKHDRPVMRLVLPA